MGIAIARLSTAVTAATASGVLTVASTTAIWPGQKGWLSKAGVTSRFVTVTEVVNGTTFRARISEPSPTQPDNTRFSDLSAFTGGSCTFDADEQVVSTNSDGGKLLSA